MSLYNGEQYDIAELNWIKSNGYTFTKQSQVCNHAIDYVE